MKRSVNWSQRAFDDMNIVFDHIACDAESAANKVADRIQQTAQNLAERSTGRYGRVGGTYEKPVVGLPYIVSYAIESDPVGGERIVILRIIHMSRNWPSGKFPN